MPPTIYPNVIEYYQQKCKLTNADLMRALGCTHDTLAVWKKDYRLLRMGHIDTLGGLFGIESVVLFYLLKRNKRRYIDEDAQHLTHTIKDQASEYLSLGGGMKH
jgi:hypothetical protein